MGAVLTATVGIRYNDEPQKAQLISDATSKYSIEVRPYDQFVVVEGKRRFRESLEEFEKRIYLEINKWLHENDKLVVSLTDANHYHSDAIEFVLLVKPDPVVKQSETLVEP